MKKQLKPMPSFRSDEEAERFVAEADLSEYDFSNFKPMRFELRPSVVDTLVQRFSDFLNRFRGQAKQTL